MIIPSAISQIDTAEISDTLIDNNKLLMMSPHNSEKLIRVVDPIGMPEHFDVLVRQSEHSFRVGTVVWESELDLLVDEHIDSHARFGLALEQLVESPLVATHHGPLQVDLGAQKEARDEDLLSGGLDRVRYGVHVVAAVDKPFAV